MFTTALLTVAGLAIPIDQLHGQCTIRRRENEASTMDISLIPPPGLQDIDYWRGKAAVLSIDGVTVFTGKVDEPIVDVIGKKITLACSDNRREKLNTELAASIGTIGFYSDALFQAADNVVDELDQRLQTIPSAVDIKPDGSYAITDINPKAIPDFTLVDADVYRRIPKVSHASRAKLKNQIDLTFRYRYTRLRHRERGFKIQDGDFCTLWETTGLFTAKNTFLNYARSMGWLMNEATIVWEEMPPSHWVDYCAVAPFAYVTNPLIATSLTFDSSTRFAQTITEEFNVTVKASQSIAQYGLINWPQANGYEFDYDAKDWEQYEEYSAPAGGTADANDYYIDQPGDIADFDNAILTGIHIAATTIIKSHRDNQTDFETDLRLDFNLTHTIELNTAPLSAYGKVTVIEHKISFKDRNGTTNTEISQSTAQGVQTPDALTVPVRPAVPVVSDAWPDPWVMLIADGQIVTPAIDATSRDEQIVNQPVTYNIEIQNDTLEVTF